MAPGMGALLPMAVALGPDENGSVFIVMELPEAQASLFLARNYIPARAARFPIPFH